MMKAHSAVIMNQVSANCPSVCLTHISKTTSQMDRRFVGTFNMEGYHQFKNFTKKNLNRLSQVFAQLSWRYWGAVSLHAMIRNYL